jgi:hypothetical protein
MPYALRYEEGYPLAAVFASVEAATKQAVWDESQHGRKIKDVVEVKPSDDPLEVEGKNLLTKATFEAEKKKCAADMKRHHSQADEDAGFNVWLSPESWLNEKVE